jgi:hypothetical protein
MCDDELDLLLRTTYPADERWDKWFSDILSVFIVDKEANRFVFAFAHSGFVHTYAISTARI